MLMKKNPHLPPPQSRFYCLDFQQQLSEILRFKSSRHDSMYLYTESAPLRVIDRYDVESRYSSLGKCYIQK
jgi:hypothetical protein